MRRGTRSELIDELRGELMKLADDEHSICEVAAKLGVFCGGFAQWTFSELKSRYPMIVRSRPRITPDELKELANRWQIVRQEVLGTELSCDTQVVEHGIRTCHGWEEWNDDDLARFFHELTGEEFEVAPGESAEKTD